MRLSENFWNFRGSFKVAKVIEIGTHMSLVRRPNGKFLVLDSYDLDGEQREQLLRLTDGGAAVEAILNVHPFHTVFCRAAHRMLPNARLLGTRRHLDEVADLPWEDRLLEDPATQAEFSDSLDFSVPDGVDLVTEDPNVHAGSVLVRHRESGIVHVDDTLNVIAAPGLLGRLLPQSSLKFHPMLGKALEDRPGAAADFEHWARSLADDWSDTRIVCAAHSDVRRLGPMGWRKEILKALKGVGKTLDKHRERFA
ncbi:hypothetical protein WJS89_12300 [Sphingomicrobium sp. XHP0235]|uniref:hypothetical protein n=1 Tax=Sphingomicrobium aquimarinum TaxID=3133971 RepID=UPI0031FE81FA